MEDCRFLTLSLGWSSGGGAIRRRWRVSSKRWWWLGPGCWQWATRMAPWAGLGWAGWWGREGRQFAPHRMDQQQ
ncbi:unnamed protein product [Nyctereutes procyonoides]|uniref:(raccoon dog) hypothetical protein n=1 Tax=Nyctereutes procyonoides TaxID=34880 RepID=A0A811ZUS5_NYCPR|nr:unnamed protein product [Nyctereutes procyonoides]